MLTRFFSVSVASSLQEIPGATSFHSGSAQRGSTGTTGAPAVSAAIRRARRPQSDADGRRTSIGQETKESMIGRSASISCRQSAHADARLANRRGGIHLTFLSGSPLWQPITRCVEPFVRVTEITVGVMELAVGRRLISPRMSE